MNTPKSLTVAGGKRLPKSIKTYRFRWKNLGSFVGRSRILIPCINGGICLCMREGVSSVKEIDTAIKAGQIPSDGTH